MALAAKALLLGQTGEQVLAALKHALKHSLNHSPLEPDFSSRLELAGRWLAQHATPSAGEVARGLGNGMTAPTSCVTALYIAFRFLDQDFAAMLRFVIACGGDVDTLGAMAGALWGVRNLIETTARTIFEQQA